MTPTTVDARGLACPQPVILTRKALKAGDLPVITIVDSETSQHNVTRMAEKQGYVVSAEVRDDAINLTIGEGAQSEATPQPEAAGAPASGPLVLLVSSEHMGRGDQPDLGALLMRAFFHTLGEVEPLPETIIFLNSGVKLAIDDSPVLEDLQALEASGIEVLACGTCLEFFGLKERAAVGVVSNMYTIAEALLGAGKVVNL